MDHDTVGAKDHDTSGGEFIGAVCFIGAVDHDTGGGFFGVVYHDTAGVGVVSKIAQYE